MSRTTAYTIASTTIAAMLTLAWPGTVDAELVRQSHMADCAGHGVEQRLVYDVENRTWWFPDLTHFTGSTRAEQESAIQRLNRERYGNVDAWRMASGAQTNAMKDSLASMAPARNRIPWDFAHLELEDPLVPDTRPERRTVGSPRLAWPVHAERFFTPTESEGYVLFGRLSALVFNGRVDETPAWRRNDDSSVTWSRGEADDHWMQLELANPGVTDTMLFNGDLHVLPDDAREHGYLVPGVDVLGAVGAWVASESRPEQLVVRAYVDGESEDELSIRIPGREWLDVVQINPDQTRIVSPIGECDLKRSGVDDVDGDEIDDLTVVFHTGCLAKGHRGLLVGFFDERFGGAAFRGCDDFSAAPVRVSAENGAPGAVD